MNDDESINSADIKTANLPQNYLDQVERFQVAYNNIDSFMRQELDADERYSFSDLVRMFAARHRWWKADELLLSFARLRNSLVHRRFKSYEYIAVPTPETVDQIEGILEELRNPRRIFDIVQPRRVVTVDVNDTLAQVLRLINERHYAQFPVYDGNRYLDLLTENGITRWLAHNAARRNFEIDLNEAQVQDLIQEQEDHPNEIFVSRQARAEEVAYSFAANPYLEAALVTEHGSKKEALLGIVTRSDILKLLEDLNTGGNSGNEQGAEANQSQRGSERKEAGNE